MFSAAAKPFPTGDVVRLMDSRIFSNPATGRSEDLILLANHTMRGKGNYPQFGVVGSINADVHMTAAQSVLRTQHPALLSSLHDLMEKTNIGKSNPWSAGDPEQARKAIDAEAAEIRALLAVLTEVHGETTDVTPVERGAIESYVRSAMEILGITPTNPQTFYVQAPKIGTE